MGDHDGWKKGCGCGRSEDRMTVKMRSANDEQHIGQKKNNSDLKVSSWLPPVEQSQKETKMMHMY